MAGVQGFEPWDGGIRIRCLTAWLYPNIRDEKRYLVRVVRFELAHLSELEPESSASTNSAIPAKNKRKCYMLKYNTELTKIS